MFINFMAFISAVSLNLSAHNLTDENHGARTALGSCPGICVGGSHCVTCPNQGSVCIFGNCGSNSEGIKVTLDTNGHYMIPPYHPFRCGEHSVLTKTDVEVGNRKLYKCECHATSCPLIPVVRGELILKHDELGYLELTPDTYFACESGSTSKVEHKGFVCNPYNPPF